MKDMIKPALVIIMSMSMLANAQKIYRLVDESGKVYFTDTPTKASKEEARPVSKIITTEFDTYTKDPEDYQALVSSQEVIQDKSLQKNNGGPSVSVGLISDKKQAMSQSLSQQVYSRVSPVIPEHCYKLAAELSYLKNQSVRIANARNSDGSFRVMSSSEKRNFISNKQKSYKSSCSNYYIN